MGIAHRLLYRLGLWLRGHAAGLLRLGTVVIVVAITVIAAHRCYGLVGPPG